MGRRETDTVRVDIDALLAATMLTRRFHRFFGLGWASIGAIFVFASLVFLTTDAQQQSALSQELADTPEIIWNVSWALGGGLIILGALWPHFALETTGHIMITAAMFVYAVAIITAIGFPPTIFLVLIIVGLSVSRIYFLVKYADRLMVFLRNTP